MANFVENAQYAQEILYPPLRVPSSTIPPAWARNRSELAEALDHFQCISGTTFVSDGVVLGCLIDQFNGSYLDSEILIVRIPEVNIRAWRKTLEFSSSVVVLMDRLFPLCTVRLEESRRFVVMDNFRVSMIWAERDGYMAKLQKCNLKSRSWWTPLQPNPPAVRDSSSSISDKININQSTVPVECEACGENAPWIYREAWFCPNPDCVVWSQKTTGMTLAPGFLSHRSFLNDNFQPTYGLGADNLCPKCHFLGPKIFWNVWACTECEGVRVESKVGISVTPRSYAGHPPIQATWPKEIEHQGPVFRPTYRVDKWTLQDDAKLILISPTAAFNAIGPDMMFKELQQDANEGKLGLHRSYDKGMLLPFFHNNFETTPVSVKAKELLYDLGRSEMGVSMPSQVQVFGYVDGMRMPWHADEQEELISTIFIGGDATFHLRWKENRRLEIVLPIIHGSVVIMQGQTYYEHKVETQGGMRFAVSTRNGIVRQVFTEEEELDGTSDDSDKEDRKRRISRGQLGIPKWTQAEINSMFRLKDQGLTWDQVAEKLGTGRNAGSCKTMASHERNRRSARNATFTISASESGSEGDIVVPARYGWGAAAPTWDRAEVERVWVLKGDNMSHADIATVLKTEFGTDRTADQVRNAFQRESKRRQKGSIVRGSKQM